MSTDKPQQNFYPIDNIGMFEDLTIAGIENTEENLASFMEAKDKPHVLDDEIVDRGIRLYKNQLEDADCMDKQIAMWKKQTLTDEQSQRVESLSNENNKFRELSNFILI